MYQSESTAEIAAALAKAQSEMEPALFNRINPHFKNKYADLTSIISAIKPLAANGISFTQQTGYFRENGTFGLRTTLWHTSGQWLACEYPLPLDGKSQELGSALTYAKRYSLASLVGMSAEEDDDAEAASTVVVEDTGTIDGKQIQDMADLIEAVDARLKDFLSYAKVSKLAEIRKRDYDRLMQKLQQKRRKE